MHNAMLTRFQTTVRGMQQLPLALLILALAFYGPAVTTLTSACAGPTQLQAQTLDAVQGGLDPAEAGGDGGSDTGNSAIAQAHRASIVPTIVGGTLLASASFFLPAIIKNSNIFRPLILASAAVVGLGLASLAGWAIYHVIKGDANPMGTAWKGAVRSAGETLLQIAPFSGMSADGVPFIIAVGLGIAGAGVLVPGGIPMALFGLIFAAFGAFSLMTANTWRGLQNSEMGN